MKITEVSTDSQFLQQVMPGLNRVKSCRWVVGDDSDDGIPGLVSHWLYAVVVVDEDLAEFLNSFATSASPALELPQTLAPDAHLAWRTGEMLSQAMGCLDWHVEAAIADDTLALKLTRGG